MGYHKSQKTRQIIARPQVQRSVGIVKRGTIQQQKTLRRVIVSGMILIAEKIIHVMRGRVNEIEEYIERVNSRQYPFCGQCYLMFDTQELYCKKCKSKAERHEQEWRLKYGVAN